MEKVINCPSCNARHVPTTSVQADGVYAGTCESCGNFFKFRTVAPFKSSITLTVNGTSYTVGNEYDVSTSLNDFLRESRASVGTKVMCRQGGCGICIVEAKIQQTPTAAKVSMPVNSCLCPLFMCDGWEITTTEGLGNHRTGLHKVQKQLADFGGTQCGYCSPGQVMNMYALTQKYSHLTPAQIESSFEGNICRCTGYRSILDAMKSHAGTQVDIEDISRLCVRSGKPCRSGTGACSGHCPSAGGAAEDPRAVKMVFQDTQWMKATDYADLLSMLAAQAGKKIRILGANTGRGLKWEEDAGNFDVVIDISGVQDFYINNYDASIKKFTVGANQSLTTLMEIFNSAGQVGANAAAFGECAKYLTRVASWPIRSRGTWAGNLMLKHKYNSFQSDVFNLMQVLQVVLSTGPLPTDVVNASAFLAANLTGKVLSKLSFTDIPATDIVQFFKIMPRSQNSLALVNAGFRCTVGAAPGFAVSGKPIISMGGIKASFTRATNTENYLVGKRLSDPNVLRGAMAMLATEAVPDSTGGDSDPMYRKCLAQALLYKYILHVLGPSASARCRSGATDLHDIRPVSSGSQTYDTNKIEWPLNQPMKKLEADIQVTGEADFVDDMPALPGQLYAAFVTSTVGNATIQTIDSSDAMKMAGVVRIVTSSDIPAAGVNNFFTLTLDPRAVLMKEEVLCSGQVQYHGQAVALVLAESQKIANRAARMVKVTYTNVQKPILDIDEAIVAGSTIPMERADLSKGKAELAIAGSPHVVSGTAYCGEQFHFHMETQSSNCVPSADGLEIHSSTQWADHVQEAVANVTGMKKSSIKVNVKRLGGAYGAKGSRNSWVAAGCALGAVLTNRPVRSKMTLRSNMAMMGKRFAYRADYKVGFNDTGVINGIVLKYYGDCGCTANEESLHFMYMSADGAYYCPNWHISIVALKTNKPSHTFCRAPGTTPSAFFIETIMEHVAKSLNMDPTAARVANLYQLGQTTPTMATLNHCNIRQIVTQLKTDAQLAQRQQDVSSFNRDNRWKKKGLSLVPIRFAIAYFGAHDGVLVDVYQKDGSVAVSHGGIEMGQGLNTKVAQVVAYELGIGVDKITVHATSTLISPNNFPTGGSVGSEVCCMGAIAACKAIRDRMAPVKAKLADKSWLSVVQSCFHQGVSISEKASIHGSMDLYLYSAYGACVSEVLLDVLTGEHQITRVDILYDCGESLNPAVDVGQVEGAFVMGLGYLLSEENKYDVTSGENLSCSTWTYHPPTTKDIPVDFRISLLKNAPNPMGVLRSKASGEPPLLMSVSAFLALKHAIEAARSETGDTAYFAFDSPMTVEKTQLACKLDASQFTL